MKKLAMVLMVVAVGLWMATSAQAGVIAGYTFTGNVLTATTVDSNASATAISAGAGIAVPGHFFCGDWAAGGDTPPVLECDSDNGYSGNEANCVAGNEYFAWTVTANKDYALDLDSLAFRMACGTNASSLGMPWYLYSDVDGFTSPNHIAAGSTAAGAVVDYSVDLSASKFNGLSSITFRMYNDSRWYVNTTYWDNINLNGTVASTTPAPEPATMLLVGTGLIGVIGIIRRRRMQ